MVTYNGFTVVSPNAHLNRANAEMEMIFIDRALGLGDKNGYDLDIEEDDITIIKE